MQIDDRGRRLLDVFAIAPLRHGSTLRRMPHYVAFLRGINLGNRRLKMDALRAHFVALGLSDVSTFIASGNVLFSSRSADGRKLAQKIQGHLHKALGYEVDAFVRTRAEVAAIAAHRPFIDSDLAHPAHTVHVAFLSEPLSAAQAKGLVACRTEVDGLSVNGREFYWLCRIKSHESTVWAQTALRALKLPSSSMRSLTTIRKLAGLYPPPPT